MSRPPFEINSDQAAALQSRVVEIDARFPLKTDGSRQHHRPFVHDFLRAVYDITGKIYSPKINRMLLKEFAEGRNPSNETLDSEKKALEQELAQEAEAARSINAGSAGDLYQVVRRAVRDEALLGFPVQALSVDPGNVAIDQRNLLLAQLNDLTAQLAKANDAVVQANADAAAARAECRALTQQVEQSSTAAKEHAAALMKIAEAAEANRKFAFDAMDRVRGETRAWQDRYANLEQKYKELKQEAEYFRQMAYARGAPVPAHLRGESKV